MDFYRKSPLGIGVDLLTFYCFCNMCLVFAPAGFWPGGQDPRRHPRIPRVYTYKDKEYLLKK